MPTTTEIPPSALNRLTQTIEPGVACRGLLRPRACAGCTRPTPASTRSSRSVWSCRGRSTTWRPSSRSPRTSTCRSCRAGRPPACRARPSAPAIIIDFSKYLNRIGIVDRDAMTVRVEPGVVLDQLNAHLKPLGLMFGPDVSTSDRATIGGMIGNNSAGARSLRYGKTVDHVRVDRGRAGRRHDGDARPGLRGSSSTRFAHGPTRSARSIAWCATRSPRTSRPSATDFRTSCAGSAATTSMSSCPACRCGRRAGTTSPGSSTWRG